MENEKQVKEKQVLEVIQQDDGKWFLFDSKGEKRIAGPFDTREEALRIERAIHAQKANESIITEQGSVQTLLNFWRGQSDPGTFRKCVRTLSGKPNITNVNALCSWIHKQATGIWPAQHESLSEAEAQNWDVQRVVFSKEHFPNPGAAFRFMEENELKQINVKDTLDVHVFECAPREKFEELHHFIDPLSGVKLVLGRLAA